MMRSPELAPLSRDHHVALGAALTLRRVTEESLAEALAEYHEFFAAAGDPHFVEEEDVLVPELPQAMARRVVAEHDEIRERTALLADRPDCDAARELGEMLTAHVRYEEREVFPFLEQSLSPERLAELGARLAPPAGEGQ